MIDQGKKSVLGVMVDAVDYEAAVARIVAAAKEGRPYGVTALAVHGVMTGVGDPEHLWRLNELELVVPDGQPVRWALNLLHKTGLPDRVYGPRLMLEVCRAAEAEGLSIFLYGSRQEVLERLEANLKRRFPKLQIAGAMPSRFRNLTPEERDQVVGEIRKSGARMTFVGLGCPRQEVFAYEMRGLLGMPVIAVGAAFDFHAGLLREAPLWMQRYGLQWFHRLLQEPRRLWRRYLPLNTAYLALLLLQWAGIWPPPLIIKKPRPPSELRYG
uniref:Glycosyltransferase n=1 Tax=Thermus tengchongensis TaxID=1214928 RepID=A0A7V4AMK2_9DEIN